MQNWPYDEYTAGHDTKNVLNISGSNSTLVDGCRKDERYKGGPTDAEFPNCESLKLTIGKEPYTAAG